ncbi:MAG: hypothetical protein ABIP61_07590, partial [Burkholderiaceae bacterium]
AGLAKHVATRQPLVRPDLGGILIVVHVCLLAEIGALSAIMTSRQADGHVFPGPAIPLALRRFAFPGKGSKRARNARLATQSCNKVRARSANRRLQGSTEPKPVRTGPIGAADAWSEIQFAGRHGSLRKALAPRDGAALVAIGLRGQLPTAQLSALFEDGH